MFKRILALIIKETLAVLRDRKSRILLIVPPIMQLFIFSYAATLEVKHVPIGILNKDAGNESIELVHRFEGSSTFTNITFLKSDQEISPFIENQKGSMVVTIEQDFSKNIKDHTPAKIQLILDGRKSNTAQIIAGYATSIISQFSTEILNQIDIGMNGNVSQPTYLVERNWFNPNLLYSWYNLPCLCGVLTMVVGISITALSIARERELGTFDQLLVSPLMPFEILLGKAIPPIAIGLFEGTIILCASIFVFEVPFTGSFLAFYLSLLIFITSIVGIGLFISSLCTTQQQAILGSFVFISPAILLSGFATPIENMPEWLQIVTYANPLKYFIIISKGSFLKAMPFHIILENLWPMVVLAFINLNIASWFFRRGLN